MIGLNDSRREDPDNFRVIFGLFNQSEQETDTTQHVDLDLIIRVSNMLFNYSDQVSNMESIFIWN